MQKVIMYIICYIYNVSNPVIINSDILFLNLLQLTKYKVQDFRIEYKSITMKKKYPDAFWKSY